MENSVHGVVDGSGGMAARLRHSDEPMECPDFCRRGQCVYAAGTAILSPALTVWLHMRITFHLLPLYLRHRHTL